MNAEELQKVLKECFRVAEKTEQEGRKHKGLLLREPNKNEAQGYIRKAKLELELCDLYKQKGIDYKISEEWFYTLYYCALAILSVFGVETRSQKYTALLITYLQKNNSIEYDEEFITRITVHEEKSKTSDVDERETSRYSSAIKIERISERYDDMALLCKRAISQCEDIVYSKKEHVLPKEIIQ